MDLDYHVFGSDWEDACNILRDWWLNGHIKELDSQTASRLQSCKSSMIKHQDKLSEDRR